MPPFALANHLWTGVGEVEELRGLTWVEEKLIARTHVSIQLQKCRLRRNYSWDQFYPQSRLKGHITTYPMNPTIALQTLPLPLDRISEVIKMVFLTRREISLREASSLSFFLVRKEKVFTALQWLRLNNPLYANVELDEDALNALPLHGLPKQVYDTITFSNRLTEDIMGHSRYDESDDLEDDDAEIDDDHERIELEDILNDSAPVGPAVTISISISAYLRAKVLDQASTTFSESSIARPQFSSLPSMHCCGVIDTEGTSVSAESKINQALQGIYIPHDESQHHELPTEFPTYRYSDTSESNLLRDNDLVEVCTEGAGFANEYEPRHLANAFPTLFPFGTGLFANEKRRKRISWEKQIASHLKQSHQLFARHEIYMFVVFNILQRRKICLGARLLARRSDLPQVSELLRSLDYATVRNKLSAESSKAAFFNDPTLVKIMKLTSVANGHIKGSREEAARYRAEIRGENIRFGASKFFITLNPDETKHPLILGLDRGKELLWWKSSDTEFNDYLRSRYKLISQNPVLQAQFFDIVMSTILEVLFGFGHKSRIGILGEVASYYFVIESQGKGTLHAHGLIWLTDGTSTCPNFLRLLTNSCSGMTPDQFREKLNLVPSFKERVIEYLEKVIKLDFDWAPDVDISDLSMGRRWEHPSYDFPDYGNGIRGNEEQWFHQFNLDTKSIAVCTQVHRHSATCYKKGKGKGCRFGFSGEGKVVVPITVVDLETGQIELQRRHRRVNNHNPALSAVTRSNHDIKAVFTSGYQSLSSMYYMTAYVAKNEDDISDLVAMEESWKELERRGIMRDPDSMERMRRLVIRINYTRAYSRQFSGAQIAAMLLGIGNEGTHYAESTFASLNLFAAVYHLENNIRDTQLILNRDAVTYADDAEAQLRLSGGDEGEESLEVTEIHDVSSISIPASVENYIYRGKDCDEMSLYEMTMKTEVKAVTEAQRQKYGVTLRDNDRSTQGRAFTQKAPLLANHTKAQSHWISFFMKDHTPVIYGPTVPRADNDDEERLEVRAFLLLTLFKEWRVKSNLKAHHHTWRDALAIFEDTCRQKGHVDRLRWMGNIDLLTKSRADAEEERAARQTSAHESRLNVESSDFSRSLPRADSTQIEPIFPMEDDSVSIQNYLTYNNPDAVTSPQYRFVINILSTAKVLNILPTSFASHTCFGNFSSQELLWRPWRQPEYSQGEVTETTVKKWRENIALELKTKRQALTTQVNPDSLWQLSEKRSEISSPYQRRLYSQRVENLFAEICTESNLNYKQQVAFELFTTPLKRLLLQRTSINDDGESNLRNRGMYLGGSGGTGKSRVIHAIKALFDKAGCRDLLMVTATTGSAANLIGGSTIDSVCKFSRRDRSDTNLGDYEEDRPSVINNSWNAIRFLIIDEVSMVGCHKLSRISKALQRAKHSTLPFGGLFVLFGGDFHQLPPIQDKCLYHNTPQNTSTLSKKRDISYREGFQLWKEVTNTTVLLTQNYRAVDRSLAETLERLRVGNITSLDIDLLKRRVFGHPLGPDTLDPKWQSAILITTRNAVRQAWNNQAALRHALKTRGQVYISPASDKGIQCRRSNMIWTPDSKTEFLATWNVLCIDGPAVVTSNVAVELGIANGTDVIIREVIPHPTDQVGQTNMRHQVVQLTRPPICVFVELQDSERKWNEIYHIEHPTWFPIMTITEQIKAPKEFGTQKMFERTQIPLTLAFAMSDHKVQGKGMRNAFILDLEKPLTGKITLENIYVMISRGIDWNNLGILRTFDSSLAILKGQIDERTLANDEWLESQDRETLRKYEERDMAM